MVYSAVLEISESELVLGMGLWGYPVRDRGLAGGIPNYIGVEPGGSRRGYPARKMGLAGWHYYKKSLNICMCIQH